jgi:hypothetical protein
VNTRKHRSDAAEAISDYTVKSIGKLGESLNGDDQSESMYFRRFVQIIGCTSAGFMGLFTLALMQYIANSKND